MLLGLFRKKKPGGTVVSLRQEGDTIWLDAPRSVPCRVKIFDLAGRRVADYPVNTNTGISLAYLPRSLYKIRLSTGDGFRMKQQITIGFEPR